MVNELQELALEASIDAEHEDRLNETLSLDPTLPPLVASLRAITNMLRKERERFLEFKGVCGDIM